MLLDMMIDTKADVYSQESHGHKDQKSRQQEEEKGAGFPSKITHKVQSEVHRDGLSSLEWEIPKNGPQCIGGGMVTDSSVPSQI